MAKKKATSRKPTLGSAIPADRLMTPAKRPSGKDPLLVSKPRPRPIPGGSLIKPFEPPPGRGPLKVPTRITGGPAMRNPGQGIVRTTPMGGPAVTAYKPKKKR